MFNPSCQAWEEQVLRSGHFFVGHDMKKTAAVLALVFIVGTVAAADDPVATKAKLVKERTDDQIKRLEDFTGKLEVELARVKKGTINAKAKDVYIPQAGFQLAESLNDPKYDPKKAVVFKSKEAKEAATKNVEKMLEAEKDYLKEARKGPNYGTLSYPAKIGDIGKVYPGKEQRVNVFQVIDKDTMLVKVFPVNIKGGVIFMVKNYPNKGATDGAGFDLDHPFEVTDTTTYKTALGGSNTVFVLEPLDTKKIEAHLKEKAK